MAVVVVVVVVVVMGAAAAASILTGGVGRGWGRYRVERCACSGTGSSCWQSHRRRGQVAVAPAAPGSRETGRADGRHAAPCGIAGASTAASLLPVVVLVVVVLLLIGVNVRPRDR